MSKKIEKLKEINTLLNDALCELETRIFIENGNNEIKKTNGKYIKPLCG
jgi:hypothetical protein